MTVQNAEGNLHQRDPRNAASSCRKWNGLIGVEEDFGAVVDYLTCPKY